MNNYFSIDRIHWIYPILMSLIFSTSLQAISFSAEETQDTQKVLTLQQLAEVTLHNDPWLAGNQYTEESIKDLSISASTLPDPKVTLGLNNIAANSFNFSQEGMTSFSIGLSQNIPRGDSLALKKQQLELMGSQYPYQRLNRKALLILTSSKIWLEAYKAQQSIELIEQDRGLFKQLADVAQVSYSSTAGRTRQQDLIRADLELINLDDRLMQLKQKRDMALKKLLEWLSDYSVDQYNSRSLGATQLSLAKTLPDIKMLNSALYQSELPIKPEKLYPYLADHPAILSLEQKIKASEKGIELAKQKYKPEWGLNAAYGYRDHDLLGNTRSDLFSVGISFDLPFFTANRQDKQVKSAINQSESVKTEKWLAIRQLMAEFESTRYKLIRLNERRELFNNKLLPQTHIQAEASLTAYTNDAGDFAEVVRARIAELNASLEKLTIDVDRQQSIIELNYLFMKQPMNMIESAVAQGEK